MNIDSEQVWEKKGRGQTKAAQFNDSPELRHALEDAMSRRGVQAVILDEAQHLMKLGRGSSAGQLLDQLDWIKSMTNVTGVVHILIGTYELLSFRNLSGQASRRGLDLHFPRYLYQHEPDRQAFQGVLLALLLQVPLSVELELLMQHWVYFYERSIGCVGVLKDWLTRAVAAALYDASEALTLEYLQDHALSLAQCERMALDAMEGEQELRYAESRREPLWRLLQAGMDASAIPAPVERSAGASAPAVPDETISTSSSPTDSPPKTTRRKRTTKTQDKGEATPQEAETEEKPPRQKRQSRPKAQTTAQPAEQATSAVVTAEPPVEAQSFPQEVNLERPPRKNRQTRKKTQGTVEKTKNSTLVAETVSPDETKFSSQETESTEKPPRKKRQPCKKTQAVVQAPDPLSSVIEATDQKTEWTAEELPPQQKRTIRVGQRKPKRDLVGH